MATFKNNVNFSGFMGLNFVVHNAASAPSSPKIGQLWYDTVNNVQNVWNGTAWRPSDASKLTDGSIPIAALATNPLARANHTGTQLAATISDLATVVQAYRLDQFAAPTVSVSFGGQRLTNLLAGSAGTDAVNLTQMNTAIAAAVQGVTSIKDPVRTVATTNIASLSGVGAVHNGVTLAANDRILLTAQSSGPQNLIYVVQAGAWVLATDGDAVAEFRTGTQVLVSEGTMAGAVYRITTTGTITPGTTSVTWVQTNSVTSYTADPSTMTLTSFTFAVKIDPAGWLTSSGSGVAVDKTKVPGKFIGTITHNGVLTAFTLTHNLNNTCPMVVIRDSTGNEVLVDNQASNANQVIVTFGAAETNGTAYTVMILG